MKDLTAVKDLIVKEAKVVKGGAKGEHINKAILT